MFNLNGTIGIKSLSILDFCKIMFNFNFIVVLLLLNCSVLAEELRVNFKGAIVEPANDLMTELMQQEESSNKKEDKIQKISSDFQHLSHNETKKIVENFHSINMKLELHSKSDLNQVLHVVYK